MNKFKIGDTVWTVKRGKCEVTGNNPSGLRPYSVFSMRSGYHYPKLSNLYRTEAEMLEAKYPPQYYPSGWQINITHEPRTITPQPKFKKGDKVYYEGKKWEVFGEGQEKPNRYQLRRGDTKRYLLAYADESDLRLWKEHELTHCLKAGSGNWKSVNEIIFFNRSNYATITHVGVVNKEDHFLAYKTGEENKHPYFFKGKKGDIEI